MRAFEPDRHGALQVLLRLLFQLGRIGRQRVGVAAVDLADDDLGDVHLRQEFAEELQKRLRRKDGDQVR